MKLLIAVKVAAGAAQPTFPANSGNYNYGSQMHQFADGSKLYVAIVDAEAAFEITE